MEPPRELVPMPMSAPKPTRWWAKGVLALVGIAAGFAALELMTSALIAARVIPSYVALPRDRVYHDVLGYALPPNAFAEIDANGFRNESVPASATIVAIGDSQTYGYNALAADTWPERLEARTGIPVYNMGIPGWGPAQYRVATDGALALSPRVVVYGFYLGNDIPNICEVLALDHWKRYAAERGVDISDCQAGYAVNDFASPPGAFERVKDALRSSKFLNFLRRVPAVSDLVARLRYERLAGKNPGKYLAIDEGPVRTIFSLDDSETIGIDTPLKRKGIEIAGLLYGDIIAKVRAAGARMLVVFIPDKVDVYYDYLVAAGYPVPDRFREMVEYERALAERFTRYFSAAGVPTVNARPAMVARLSDAGAPLFSNNLDTHPTAAGYDAIAEAAAGPVLQLLK